MNDWLLNVSSTLLGVIAGAAITSFTQNQKEKKEETLTYNFLKKEVGAIKEDLELRLSEYRNNEERASIISNNFYGHIIIPSKMTHFFSIRDLSQYSVKIEDSEKKWIRAIVQELQNSNSKIDNIHSGFLANMQHHIDNARKEYKRSIERAIDHCEIYLTEADRKEKRQQNVLSKARNTIRHIKNKPQR